MVWTTVCKRKCLGEGVDFVSTGKILYILNIHAHMDMTNGFRYFKELLLQRHSYAKHDAWSELRTKGVEVFAVKTDAFTIKAEGVSKAHEVRDFTSDNANLEEAVDCLLEYTKALKKNPKNLLKSCRFID